jgi:cysteine desulfurase/selenocysteine lyase
MTIAKLKSDVETLTESYRPLFPHTKHQVYFNHAAVSPLSNRVMDAFTAYLKERNETDIENYPTLVRLLVSAKNAVATLINADSRNIAFVPNTSYGLNILAQGLTWQSGDRILLADIEFPSNVYPFQNLTSQGVEIDFIKSRDGKILLEDIEKMLTPRTRLFSISHVQFLTGYRSDLKAISNLCKKHDVVFSVDAIQSIGAMQIDVKDMGIDFLAAGCHKWGMSPMGTGFIYLTDAMLARLRQPFVGWLSVEDAWNMLDYNLTLLPDARRFELGTQNWMGMVGLNAAFSVFHDIGQAVIQKKILLLSGYLAERLTEHGYELACDAPVENRSGIVSFKAANADDVFKTLMSHNIETATRIGLIRVSPHFYNTTEEIDLFIEALNTITHK